MSQKYLQITYHANLNVNLTVKNLIQIKSGITINVDASVKIKKNIVFAKKTIFSILLLRCENYLASIIQESVLTLMKF